MVIITLVALSVVIVVVAAADASVAVSVQRGNDTFLVDLVLRYWRWCGLSLAVLTDLFRLVGLRRLPLGLCVRVGLRLPGFVLASDESGL